MHVAAVVVAGATQQQQQPFYACVWLLGLLHLRSPLPRPLINQQQQQQQQQQQLTAARLQFMF